MKFTITINAKERLYRIGIPNKKIDSLSIMIVSGSNFNLTDNEIALAILQILLNNTSNPIWHRVFHWESVVISASEDKPLLMLEEAIGEYKFLGPEIPKIRELINEGLINTAYNMLVAGNKSRATFTEIQNIAIIKQKIAESTSDHEMYKKWGNIFHKCVTKESF